MKKLILLFAIILVAFQAKAQDKLITQSGDVKIVYNVEVGPTNIFYKLENKDGASLQQILKKDVVMIIRANGKKELINTDDISGSKSDSPQNTPLSTVSLPTSGDNAEAQAINDSLIAKYNNVTVAYTDDKFKEKKKSAQFLYLLPKLKTGSVIGDANMELDIKVEKDYYLNSNTYNVTLKNKTDKTIYIDLGNTFFFRGTEATPYFTPTATSSTNGKSGGMGVNMGSVAGALGVGGVAGILANGVNVGGGVSSSSTTTTYAQRVIAVSPFSTRKLDPQPIFPLGSESLYNNLVKVRKINKTTFYASIEYENKSDELKAGETRFFDENNSPINFGSYISYSYAENCTNANHLNAKFYVYEFVGIHVSWQPNIRDTWNYMAKQVSSLKDPVSLFLY